MPHRYVSEFGSHIIISIGMESAQLIKVARHPRIHVQLCCTCSIVLFLPMHVADAHLEMYGTQTHGIKKKN